VTEIWHFFPLVETWDTITEKARADQKIIMTQEHLQEELAQLRAENHRLRELLLRQESLKTIPGLDEANGQEALESTETEARAVRSGLDEVAQPGSQRYKPSEEIGRGAVGKVMLAYDPILLREVALKTLNPQIAISPEAQKRFKAEARVTAGLGHPNIVPVFDLGRDETGWFFTMQRVQGLSLAQVIAAVAQEERRFGRNRLVGIVLQVCHAVSFAHARGVLHRDLKPQNVMVGDFGEVYLMDWGLAKASKALEDSMWWQEEQTTNTRGTQLGQVRGTPAYMAPEQAQGLVDLIDERTDIFGLGAILYEVLTYQAPINEVDIHPALQKAACADFLPPTKRAPQLVIPPELEEICLRAMAPSQQERYQNASDLAYELELYLEGAKTLERKRAESSVVAAQGDESVGRLLSLEEAARESAHRLAQLRLTVKPLDNIKQKMALWQAEDTLSQQRLEHELEMWLAVDLFHQALTLDPSNKDLRERLVRLFFHRYLFAQEHHQPVQMRLFELLSRRFDTPLVEELFSGHTEIRIEASPINAEIFFAPYVEQERCLVRGAERCLGQSPLSALLPWGSGVILVRAAGYDELAYPVFVRANRLLDISIRLFTASEIGDGFCHIPAGSFLFGGDSEAGGIDARQELFLPDFFIAKRQVTCSEYAAFLNAVAARNPQQATLHAPRLRPDAAPFWVPGADGRYSLPCRDFDGTVWEREWPVTWISLTDAESFAAFRSARDQVRYRLPNEEEWEKAARGTDGRSYPWGNHFDPTFCRMVESVLARPEPVLAGVYACDRSPYGLWDMGGNVGDLTTSPYGSHDSRRVVRGGAYPWSAESCRTTFRTGAEPHQPNGPWGFRLVKDFIE
jgi:eukaryotic-like serine/threonine-protein kinase